MVLCALLSLELQTDDKVIKKKKKDKKAGATGWRAEQRGEMDNLVQILCVY